MIGIIAGEIIGSPYGKENIPDINRIFFPLFEDNRVIDPKTYRERNYKAAPSRITDAVLKLSDDVESFTVSKPDKGDAAYGLERIVRDTLFGQMGQMNPPRPEVVSAMLKGQLVPDHDGTYTKGDGKADDGIALQGAICAVGQSLSWEEAVRRATALGGNSPLVAALAGGYGAPGEGVPEPRAAGAPSARREQRQRVEGQCGSGRPEGDGIRNPHIRVLASGAHEGVRHT